MKQKPKVLRQLLSQKAKKTSLLVPLLCSSIIVGCSDGGDDGMNWGGSQGPNLSNPSSSSSMTSSNSSSSSSSSSQTQEPRSLTGAAVDGPIANAVARVYRLDTSAANLQGTLLVEGETDAQARFSGLEIDADETGPFLIVVTAIDGTTDLNTGLPPIISEVRTVVTGDRLDRPVYATPLTSMAVSLAAKKSADAGGGTSEDFAQGLEDAASEVVSALGFGMDDEVDIFTASPMVNEDTDSDEKLTEVAKYRTAISGAAAVIFEVQKNTNARLGGSSSVSANTIMEDFAKDLSDGAIDGKAGDDETIENYSGDDAAVIVETDPAKLVIPGTDKTVEQTEELLDEEKEDVGSAAVDTSKLADGSVGTTAAPAEADIDRDKDGVINSRDAFPNDPNESVDTDGDGVGNNADPDDDNDGVRDELDAFPLDPAEKLDTDGDGTGNNADDDDDGDGVVDSEDDFPLDPEYSDASDLDGDGWPAGQDTNDDDVDVPGFPFVDTDGDGVGNTTDTDDDNDGVPDVDDDLPLDNTEASDTDGDGIGDSKDDDIDGDGVANHSNGDDQVNTPETRVLVGGDAFPFNPNEFSDLDRDGTGDNADSDADGDGLLDIHDPDPTKWDTDGDGVKDGKDALPEDPNETLDSDRDGIGNNADNCQFTANFNQLDSDEDGQGNACDSDDDNDGVADTEDDFPLDPNASSATDADNDGWPLGQDTDDNDNSVPDIDYVDSDGDGLADEGGLAPDTDDDNDGYNDDVDAFPTNPGEFEDADQDGIGNNEDPDDDNDQVPDVDDRFPFNGEESLDTDLDGIGDNSDSCPAVAGPQTDTDQDGKGDVCDTDDDNDGVEDAADRFPLNPAESKDTDGDGIGNNEDTDDDGDGLSDAEEISLGSNPLKRDTDADGVGDADDNCLLVSNADQTDSDSDEIGDACDQPITVGGYYLLQTEVVESTKAPAELDVEAIDAYECESELGDKDSEVAYIKRDGEALLLYFADDGFEGEGESASLSAQGEVEINTNEQGGPDESDWSSSLSFAGVVSAGTGVIAGEVSETFTLHDDNQELVADCHTRSTVTFTPMATADATALLGANSGFVGTYADVEYEDSRYREWLYEYEVLNTDAVSLYVWNGMEWMLDTEEPQDLVLTSTGWEWAADSISVSQAQGNTAAVQDMTVDGNVYANWNVELFSIDVEGQLMADLIGEEWGENALSDPSATFAVGAQAIALRASNDRAVYEIYCDDYDWANTGLSCVNFIEVSADEAGNFSYAMAFDDVVHSDTTTIESRQQGVVIGRDDSSDREIVAYLQTDADSLAEGTQGTVRFYLAGYDGGLDTLLNDGGQALTSSWEIVDPLDDNTHVLLEFDVPAYVLEEFDFWYDSEELFLTVLADENSSEDVLRLGNKTPAGTVNMETGINLTALQDVLANFNTEPATPDGDNLVRNGGFEAADGEYQGWFGETHMETEASFSITDEDAYSGARSLKVDVTTTGDFEWNIQGGSRFMRVTPGDSYTVMAWVKASREDTKVVLQPTKRSYPFTPYGWYEEQVGTEWTRIIGEVYVPEDNTGEMRLVLNFSFPENDGASFYVDDIQLWGNSADAPVTSGQNLAINGGLEASDTVAAQWANYAQDGAVEMSVTTQEAHSGTNALMLQLGDALLDKNAMVAMPGMHMVQGTQYVASAWVKGAAGTELELGVINSESSPLGFSDELRMTGDWQRAQFMVDASWETSSIAGLFVFADKAGNEGATFYIDDVELHGEFGGDIWPEGSPLIMNTGFEGEDGLMGWTVDTLDTDVSVTLTNTGGKDSDYAVSVTTPTGLQDGMVSLISDSVTTQGNADHVVTAWIKGTADSVVDVYLNNAVGERIGSSYPRALTGEWQQIFFRVWLAEEVTQASVGLTVVEADAEAQILIDEVQLWGPWLSEPDPLAPLSIFNSSFDESSDLTGWITTGSDANFSVDTNEVFDGSQAMRVDIVNPGAEAYSTQTGPDPMVLERGRQYRFIARVKGEAGTVAALRAVENGSWHYYGGSEVFVMDGTWQTLELNVRAHYHGSGDVLMTVDMGYAENAGSAFYIDAIEVIPTEIIDVTRDMNRGLEFDSVTPLDWFIDGDKSVFVDSSDSFAGANALKAVLDDAIPEQSWQVGASMRGVQVVPGTQYDFGGWVKGSAGSVIQVMAQTNGYPWETYGASGELTLSGEWEWVEFPVNVPEGGAEFLALATHMAYPGNENAEILLDEYGLWGLPGEPRPFGENLVANNSLEESVDSVNPWVAYHPEDFMGSMSISTAEAFTGSQSAHISVTNVYAESYQIQVGQPQLAVHPLWMYESEIWVKGTAGALMALTISSDDGNYGLFAGQEQPVVMTGDWQAIYLPFTVPAISTGRARILADLSYPENVGAEFYFDDAHVWAVGMTTGHDEPAEPGIQPNNADLEDDSVNPVGWVTPGDSTNFSITDQEAYFGSQSLQLDVTDPGTETWHTQTGPEAFYVTPGRGYDLLIRVKGAEGTTAALSAVENQTWAYFGSSGPVAMTGDWVDIWLSVNVPSASSGDIQVTADFGFAENANATFYVDAFEVMENGNVNLLSEMNPGLEWSVDSHDYWNVSGSDTLYEIDTTEVYSGAHSLKATIGTTTNNSWDVGTAMYGVPVTPGNSYEFSGWIKGTAGAQAQLIGQGGGDPYPTYGASGPTVLTGEWQHIVVQMDIPVDGLDQVNLSWHLSYEGNTGAVMYFDDLALWGKTYNDAGTDSDGDGFAEQDDNCVNIYNPEQLDDDSDGYGNVCDNDIDGDGVDNELDADPYDASVGMFDKDGDGFADQDDNCLIIANPEQLDDDDDGLGNACDVDVAGPSGAYLAERTYSSDNLVYNEDSGACEADTATLHLILETHMVGNQLFLKVRGDDEEDLLSGVVNSDGTFSMLSTPEFTGDGVYYPHNNAFELNFEDFTGSEDGSVSCYAQGTVIANAPAQVAEKPAFDAGLTWIEGYSEDGWMEVETGSLVTGEAEVIELWDNSSMMWQVESGAGERGLLTDSGAMMVSDLHSVTGFNDGEETAIVGPSVDGSVVMELAKHVELEAFPVTGLPLAPFLDETLAELIGDAVFSSGAVAYLAHVQTAVDHIEFWCDDDYDAWFEGNLLCDNIVSVEWVESTTQPGVYEPVPATSVDDVVATPSDFPTDSSYLPGGGIWIGEGWSDNGGYQIMAYMVSTDGTVQDAGLKVAFFQQFDNGTIHHLSDEPVDVSSVGGIDVYALNTPDHVYALIEDGRDGIPVVFAESSIEGTSMVRTGELMQAGPAETVFLFETTATSDIRGYIPTN